MSQNDLTPWVNVARVGTFADSQGRKHTFSEADLDSIAAGYDPKKSEAPLVFGHPKDNEPAFGWVRELKRVGGTLSARFASVPDEVKELVAKGRYRYVSMSLSPDKRRLLHVGLLGASAPAIDGLGPVHMSTDGVTINFSTSEQPGGAMGLEELQKQIGALTEKLNALQAENTAMKAKVAELEKSKSEADQGKVDAEKKAETATAEFTAYKAKQATDAREKRVRSLVDSGRLEPAKEKETLSFAAALGQVQTPVSFAAPDGRTEEISPEERYFRELEARPVDPRFANFAAHAQPGHASASAAPTWNPNDMTAKL